MQKKLPKLFIFVLILQTIFFTRVFAIQTENPATPALIVNTFGYSVLGTNSFRLEGTYDGNVNKRELTYYFEYETQKQGLRGDGLHTYIENSKTIPIVQHLCSISVICDKGHITDHFETTINLLDGKTYRFRAVAYFNGHGAEQKFYGQWLILTTNQAFFGGNGVLLTPPYTVNSNNTAVPFTGINSTNNNPTYNPLNTGRLNPTIEFNPYLGGTGNTNSDTPVKGNGLVHCGKSNVDSAGNPVTADTAECGFNDIFVLINNILHFILFIIAIPISAIMFAYAGFLYLTSGGGEQVSKAKGIFSGVATGLAIAAGAWLIIHSILLLLGYQGEWFGLQ